MSVTNLGPWLEFSQRPRLDSDTPVSRLMHDASPETVALGRGVPSVHALTTVREATHLMASQGVLHVQVKDTSGQVVGVLTVSDLYRWVTEAAYGQYEGHEEDDGPTAGHA
jgi:CBS domain-containing protein